MPKVSEVAQGARYLAEFYWVAVRYEARETWRALPGPWWVKVIIIVACLACPGQLDEIAVLAVVKFFRARQARKAVRS